MPKRRKRAKKLISSDRRAEETKHYKISKQTEATPVRVTVHTESCRRVAPRRAGIRPTDSVVSTTLSSDSGSERVSDRLFNQNFNKSAPGIHHPRFQRIDASDNDNDNEIRYGMTTWMYRTPKLLFSDEPNS